MYNCMLQYILIFTCTAIPILFYLFSLKIFKRFDLVRDRNCLFVCLLVLSFNAHVAVFIQRDFLPASGVLHWRRRCVARWWFPSFLGHLNIKSLILLHQNQEDLTQSLFFLKCSEDQGWHELKPAVVGECFAAQRGVRCGARGAASQAGLAPRRPAPGLASRLFYKVAGTPFFAQTGWLSHPP